MGEINCLQLQKAIWWLGLGLRRSRRISFRRWVSTCRITSKADTKCVIVFLVGASWRSSLFFVMQTFCQVFTVSLQASACLRVCIKAAQAAVTGGCTGFNKSVQIREAWWSQTPGQIVFQSSFIFPNTNQYIYKKKPLEFFTKHTIKFVECTYNQANEKTRSFVSAVSYQCKYLKGSRIPLFEPTFEESQPSFRRIQVNCARRK